MGKKEKPSKKTEEKRKDKVFDDKTFGLKNKKSKKVQKFVTMVQQQVYKEDPRKKQAEKFEQKKEKKKKQEEMALLGFLQKSMGTKKKEEEKKATADMTEEEKAADEKTAAINLYVDLRDPDPTRSPKICEHFLEACEKNVYGWRWTCPNGGSKCGYAHALPEGYMLKSTMEALMKMQREDDDDRGHEYQIEEERAKIDPDKCTPVNKETFEAWRKKRREKFLKERKKKEKADQTLIRGKGNKDVYLTGKALLKYNEELFKNQDEDDDGDDEEEEKYERPKEEGDEDILELRFGLDEEEEEQNREIAKAKGIKVDEELFDDDADDVDLDDLE